MTDQDKLVEELRELRIFLSGEGPMENVWFGDSPPPSHRGAFWWRKRLAGIDQAADALTSKDEEIKGLREALEEIASEVPAQVASGFVQGPAVLWAWAQRRANAALALPPEGGKAGKDALSSDEEAGS